MRVLVAAAGRHGATLAIATEIGCSVRKALSLLGERTEVLVCSADEAGPVAACDALVLGSAVYNGHWLASARRFVDRERAALAGRPVWLFSSGTDTRGPVELAELSAATGAYQHQAFPGRLDWHQLDAPEQTEVARLRLSLGDHRKARDP